MHFRVPGTKTMGKTVLGRLSHPRHYTDNRMKHTLRLYVKKKKSSYTSPGTSTWATGFRFAIYLEATKGPSGKVDRETPFLSPPLVSPQLTGTSQKGAYTFIRSSDFCNWCPKTSSDPLIWRSAGFMIVVPQDSIYLYTLKAAVWECGFQSPCN